jgi:hypothetical protein
MVTRSEATADIVDGLGEWEEAGPSNIVIVEATNEQEDCGKGNQSKPERKIVYQRVV